MMSLLLACVCVWSRVCRAPPNTREGMEAVLSSLTEAELDSWINLRHYMQRVPFTIPATASVGRAYHLFRYSTARPCEDDI
jgi:hypothetical protein